MDNFGYLFGYLSTDVRLKVNDESVFYVKKNNDRLYRFNSLGYKITESGHKTRTLKLSFKFVPIPSFPVLKPEVVPR